MIKRSTFALWLGLLWLVQLPAWATGSSRVALVVGNDLYRNLPSLNHAKADARTLANALASNGFKVTTKLDVDEKNLKKAMREFKASLAPDAEVVIYFSGHAVQLNGSNYLLPVDINREGEDQVRDESLPLQRILDDLQERKVRAALVIADACRNNPFRMRGRPIGEKGLAPLTPHSNQLVLYPAAPGKLALDRLNAEDNDPNSVFIRVLSREVERRGVSERLGKAVRDEVSKLAKTANAEQTPTMYGRLSSDFAPSVPPVGETNNDKPDRILAASTSATAPSETQTRVQSPAEVEQELWNLIKNSRDPADFDEYLSQYPNGRFVAQAKINARKLRQPGSPTPVTPTVATTPAATPAPAPVAATTTVSRTPSTPNTIKSGTVFRDCVDCPEMVALPSGRFYMGSPAGERERSENEGPLHEVNFTQPFAMSRYHVTFEEWDSCVADGGCEYRPDDHGWGRGKRPVIEISWFQARTYANWLSRKTGKKYRLPSEAEWEYATRGGSAMARPWGSTIGISQANCDGCKGQWDRKKTAPVGSFDPNAYGLFDPLGNVWSWTRDCWNEGYTGAPNDGSAWEQGECTQRVLRGGAWNSEISQLRSAKRFRKQATYHGGDTGFRVVRVLD